MHTATLYIKRDCICQYRNTSENHFYITEYKCALINQHLQHSVIYPTVWDNIDFMLVYMVVKNIPRLGWDKVK
jgi:hypothetical protein